MSEYLGYDKHDPSSNRVNSRTGRGPRNSAGQTIAEIVTKTGTPRSAAPRLARRWRFTRGRSVAGWRRTSTRISRPGASHTTSRTRSAARSAYGRGIHSYPYGYPNQLSSGAVRTCPSEWGQARDLHGWTAGDSRGRGAEGWGSRGRRFKSCHPDSKRAGQAGVSTSEAPALLC